MDSTATLPQAGLRHRASGTAKGTARVGGTGWDPVDNTDTVENVDLGEDGHMDDEYQDPAMGLSRPKPRPGTVRRAWMAVRGVAARWWARARRGRLSSPGLRGIGRFDAWRERWEEWAVRTLPRRNTHKRKLVVALFLLCAFLVLACLALAALNVLYRHRGALYLKAGGTLSPEEGVEAGVALEHLVHPSELPRNIQHGDDEATKLEKYKLHSSAHVVPHAHLPMGCEIDVEYDRLRIRSGMFDSTGPMWNPWPPIATHSFDASDGVVTKLLGVFPMHCSEAYARRDVDLHHLVDRAKPLMRHTRRKCVVGPQLGMNATVLVLHLQDEDVPFTPGSDFLFVAVDPVMELKGLSEERYHEHEETCRFRGFTPSRWRSTAIDISFTNALDGQPRMLRVVGTAAAAVQHCMDMFVSNPCVK